MESDFDIISRAIDQSDDTLFEVSRRKLPEELAQNVDDVRKQLARARASLVRLEADLLRARERRDWTLVPGEVHESRGSRST